MEEVSNQGAEQEETLVQQEAATPQAESNQGTTVDQQASDSSVQSQPDQQDKSWIKKVRRDRDDAIRAKEEAERKSKLQEELIRQLMVNQGQSQSSAQPEEDILDQIQREEYVPGEKVAKAIKREREEFRKELDKLKKMQEQQFQAKQEDQIRAAYSDYDEVVNPDTLDLLKETNPKLFNRVANLLKVDPMDGAVFAYETITAAGIVDKVPGARRAKEVEKKLDQNKKTIQSPASYDKRPMAQAMSYPETKAAREALWAETQRYAALTGGGY
jgi:hypothetical protein